MPRSNPWTRPPSWRAAVREAVEACGGDPLDAVRALIVANAALEQELAEVYARASFGFLRGRRVPRRKD
ncbi:hypothetical protein [Bradyrhizobium cytisi]|uniref:hypothetical protein n=1 Tax=Bradyrhizobium cytisi TaxID=515489 RepID=UPI001FE91E6E|nr:hypothetical protein [Bradyrhizobium cytisi]